MEEKLGFTPCAGTLDLRLDEESVARRKQLDEKYALGVCTAEGYCRGLLFKASIAGLACGIVLPQVDNYPDGLLEVVAPVNLRQKLGLHDGDTVEVTVFL
jgi:riboflavin kinase